MMQSYLELTPKDSTRKIAIRLDLIASVAESEEGGCVICLEASDYAYKIEETYTYVIDAMIELGQQA